MATSPNSRPLRAALYARVSTNDQDVGMQLDDLRRVAAQRGWFVVSEFVDEGVSGAALSRPALDKLMQAARTAKVDVVAVWRFDRFARSTQHLVNALTEFQALGVHFVSISEAIDTSTPMGKMVFTVISAVSELEVGIIRERVTAGVRRAQRAGKHCGRPVVEMDLRPALALMGQGHGLKATARMLDVSRTTLRRRLADEGLWPPERRVQNPGQ
jgi:DNA invertase Pin-like site-specific DNA recombinase